MKRKFRVALAQVETSERKEANLERGLLLAREAADSGAQLLVLPELFMAYSSLDQPLSHLLEIAEGVDGPFVGALAAEAKRRHIHVIVGIIEPSNKKSHKVYNTAVMIGPDGRLISTHRKMQQFDSFGYKESSRFEPGAGIEGAFQTKLAKIGLMTCYELRFPEIARVLALQGAELIAVPTAWVGGRMKEEHLHVLARARALENTVFIAVADQTGRIFAGRSIVVDPFGVSLCDGGEQEGLVMAEVDLERVSEVRKILPSLSQTRIDVYRKHLR